MSTTSFERDTISSLSRIETLLVNAVGEDGNGGRLGDIEHRVRRIEQRKNWRSVSISSIISAAVTGGLTWFSGRHGH